MERNLARIVIAGLGGNSGKTMISIGLIAALKNKGIKIVPFKKGPDYIDSGWLAKAAGRECHNLDVYLFGEKKTLFSLNQNSKNMDLAFIEGNRGLFDGVDKEGRYSTAGLAKLTSSPIVLVIDCTKVTRTVGAMLLGCQVFDKELSICGVILNQVATLRQEKIIREVIESECQVPVLGAIGKLKDINFPMRHLGLVPHHEHSHPQKVIKYLSKVINDSINVDRFFEIAKSAPNFSASFEPLYQIKENGKSLKPTIGVIMDPAFQFYYPENIEFLKNEGAKIVKISALENKTLPGSLDALYIGGGFPESFAPKLSSNKIFKKSLLKEIKIGLPIYAECGGLIFLGKNLITSSGSYPMVGILPTEFILEKKPQGHGYIELIVQKKNEIFSLGTKIKGHEFHYSRPINSTLTKEDFIFKVTRGYGFNGKWDGVKINHIFASFSHLHSLGVSDWAEGFVRLAKKYKQHKLKQN